MHGRNLKLPYLLTALKLCSGFKKLQYLPAIILSLSVKGRHCCKNKFEEKIENLLANYKNSLRNQIILISLSERHFQTLGVPLYLKREKFLCY